MSFSKVRYRWTPSSSASFPSALSLTRDECASKSCKKFSVKKAKGKEMPLWHHKPVPIRMLDHHRNGSNRSLNSSRAPKSVHPPIPPLLLCPTPPTPLLPPPPPQQAPPTIAQRFSPTPARVPPSIHRQATQLPGLRLVLQLARTQPNNHFLPHRWGSLVQWPPHTQVHTLWRIQLPHRPPWAINPIPHS